MTYHKMGCIKQGCECSTFELTVDQEDTSRRHFLKTAAGAGVLGLAGASSILDATARSTNVIDTHHHVYPPSYMKAWLDYEVAKGLPHFPTQVAWTIEGAVEAMDKAGVSKSIISAASTPGLWFDFELPRVQQMVKEFNDYGAMVMKKYPGRFGLFAAINMIDVESSLKEIAYAFDVLGADGVGLQTNYGDKWPGHPSFAPIFDELNRRNAIVYFHPLVASCCNRLNTCTFTDVLEVPFDTTRAITNLLLTGSLLKYRNIRWLFSHAGGTLPMLAGRIDYFHGHNAKTASFAPDGIESEFKRLYFDTANATHPSTMAGLLKLVPETQVTYGSDFPYVPMDTQLKNIENQGFSSGLVERIEYRNAQALLSKSKN
jgi:predicted TIM-barrel fold metal-dependent hydrolase